MSHNAWYYQTNQPSKLAFANFSPGNTNPQILIPAPGEGKCLVLRSVMMQQDLGIGTTFSLLSAVLGTIVQRRFPLNSFQSISHTFGAGVILAENEPLQAQMSVGIGTGVLTMVEYQIVDGPSLTGLTEPLPE